jgi:hypothetical protein
MTTLGPPLTQPKNINPLLMQRFKLVLQRLPHISFYCKSFTLPGVNIGEVNNYTPFMDTIHAGDKIIYDPLTATFIVDEDLRAWEEVYNWIVGLSFPHDFGQYANLVKKTQNPSNLKNSFKNVYGDATMVLQTSAQNSHILFKFQDVFPITLGGLNMDTTVDGIENFTCDVTFRFTYMTMERIDTNLAA